ncbi:MAG: sigma-70 family RNA polymerase sigma factor, partial [Victivallales bacterium]|nr:sigma-70 family RNA polymerase sigma factor [Victivallales bacterium]
MENPNQLPGDDQQKVAGSSLSSKGRQDIYLKQIAEYPRLTEQEELHYTRQFFEQTQLFIEELKKHPRLILHALQELDSQKNDVRIGNFIELTEKHDATFIRTQLPLVIEQLKELPQDGDYTARFDDIVKNLSLRPAFYEHCHELLKQDDIRRMFISDEDWNDVKKRLDDYDQSRKSASAILVERSLRLVISIAQKYVRDGVSLADLIQEGNIGLMKGVEKFDYRLGYRLSTYVTYWITQSITRSLTNSSRIIRISASTLKQISAIKAAAAEIQQKTGEEATPEAIADVVGLSSSRVSALLKMAEQPISLQATTEQDKHLEETIPDTNTPVPNAEADFASLKDSIKKALANLDSRERIVIIKRFGLDEKEPLTLNQVAELLNVSSERVRQIEADAIKKLRSP